jgi:hypothetical protein
VFGLDVLSARELSLLRGATAPPTGRRLTLSILGPAAGTEWPAQSELISEERDREGTLIYEIRTHPHRGYLIAGPAYGTHVLSADGRQLSCVPGEIPDAVWQRLLIAQVLPFAAVLRGLEVLHASAVAFDGGAVAFAGPSRSGKTSLALECCKLGGTFLADDVLTVEVGDGAVLAHPGSPLAGLDRAEAQRTATGAAERQVIGENERELLVSVAPGARIAPLSATFFLRRSNDGPSRVQFQPVTNAATTLASTFNFLLAGPERLLRLLEVSALIADTRAEEVHFGPSLDASALALAIAQRIRGAA